MQLKDIMKSALCAGPLSAIVRQLSRGGVILNYHRLVSPDPHTLSLHERRLGVSRDSFEAQMQFLANNAHVVPLAELVARLRSGEAANGCVAVTFDDGYLDNYIEALPILELYSIPATVFVTTAFVLGDIFPWWIALERFAGNGPDASRRYEALVSRMKRLSPATQEALLAHLGGDSAASFPPRRLFISKSELLALSRHPLITIGAHTLHHPVLSTLGAEQAFSEILESKIILEEWIGRDVDFFAYPYGQPSEAGPREYHFAARAGFRAAFTTVPRAASERDNFFSLPRVPVSYEDSLSDFRWKLARVSMKVDKVSTAASSAKRSIGNGH